MTSHLNNCAGTSHIYSQSLAHNLRERNKSRAISDDILVNVQIQTLPVLCADAAKLGIISLKDRHAK